MKISEKKRGHLKEKTERNQAIVALYLCGFSQYAIGRLLKVDRRNVVFFVRKYTPKYLETILEQEVKVISNKILKKNGRPKTN